MSQRTLILALAVVAVVVFAGIAVFIGGGSFGLFTDQGNERAGNITVAGVDDPFADQYTTPRDIQFDGEDEHGPYISGPDGQRIYIDPDGRRYVLTPDGKRVYVDEFGRPIAEGQTPPGKAGESGGTDQTGKGSPNGTEGTDPNERETDPDDAEEPDPAELSGLVVDDFGSPYPDATVQAQEVGGQAVTVKTNDEGAFTFAKLPSGQPIVLTASNAYGDTSKSVNTKLAPGATKLKSPLVLPRDTAIRGVVRHAETGLPLDGASVTLLGSGDEFGRTYKTQDAKQTDAGGAFAFEKLTPSPYRLQISLEGFAPRILNNVEPPESLVIELSPGAVISGTVSDQGGNPIANAKISCDFRAEPAQYFHTETLTDAAGFYAVKCQPESQHNTISVIAPGFKAANKTLVRSGAENVNFELAPSGNVVVRGRLLTRAGVPIQTASFYTYDAGGKYKKVVQSVGPNAEGNFWCEAVVEAVQLRVQSTGLAEVRADYTPAPGGEVDVGELYMDLGYMVYGVVHKAGEPESVIAGADISAGAIKTLSDAEGRYRLEGLSAEEFIVRVLHPAFLGNAIRITPTPAEHEIELNIELSSANFEAHLLIKEEETGEPVEGAKVTVLAYAQVHITGADGLAHLVELSSMKVDVRVEKTGYATIEQKVNADITSKLEDQPPQEILLTRGSTISGVVTSEGEPVPGATKLEIWGTTKLVTTIYTDTVGAYQTDSLPLGRYFIGLPDFHYAPRAVELTEEGLTHDIEIGRVCHLKGKLMRSDGQPHANAGVYVYRRDNVYWTSTIHTGPNGDYELANLFPGTWVFCALKTQGDTAAQFAVDVDVSKAGWTTKNVQLPQITGVITGRITYPDGQPVKRARVAVTNLSANFPRALLAAYVVTDDDGFYTAERLENGAQMQVRVGGYQDEAATGMGFSEVVTVASDNSPVEANFTVVTKGVTVRVAMKRVDDGPIMIGGPLSYLFDEQGRMAGLFFGGGTFVGHVDIYDVIPGTYTLVVTNRGMKKAELQFTVGAENISSGLEVIIEPEARGSE
ncbi:MAG: carboxypeptidase-like regulatory domain-containing protein [Planctomycetes bacterium]|nr:carboxypeptidase-like regulatory domain-containing protein [Planctomycetota bacterium]